MQRVNVDQFGQWIMYYSDEYFHTNDFSGEWLIFFSSSNFDYVSKKCRESVELGLVKRAKHSDINSVINSKSGVACFKFDNPNGIVNRQSHINLLLFLLNNKLIPITKSGKLTNIRFKVLSDGKGNHKGVNWNGFTLSDFVDLQSGEVLNQKG